MLQWVASAGCGTCADAAGVPAVVATIEGSWAGAGYVNDEEQPLLLGRANEGDGAVFRVLPLNTDGAPGGDAVDLITTNDASETGSVAAAWGAGALGLAWPYEKDVQFASFDRDYYPIAPAARVSYFEDGVGAPAIHYGDDAFGIVAPARLGNQEWYYSSVRDDGTRLVDAVAVDLSGSPAAIDSSGSELGAISLIEDAAYNEHAYAFVALGPTGQIGSTQRLEEEEAWHIAGGDLAWVSTGWWVAWGTDYYSESSGWVGADNGGTLRLHRLSPTGESADTSALVSFDGDDVALSTVRIARDGSGLVAWIREDGQAGVVRAGDDLHATGCAAITTVEPGMRLLRVTSTGDHDVEVMFLRDDDGDTSFLRWNATLLEER